MSKREAGVWQRLWTVSILETKMAQGPKTILQNDMVYVFVSAG